MRDDRPSAAATTLYFPLALPRRLDRGREASVARPRFGRVGSCAAFGLPTQWRAADRPDKVDPLLSPHAGRQPRDAALWHGLLHRSAGNAGALPRNFALTGIFVSRASPLSYLVARLPNGTALASLQSSATLRRRWHSKRRLFQGPKCLGLYLTLAPFGRISRACGPRASPIRQGAVPPIGGGVAPCSVASRGSPERLRPDRHPEGGGAAGRDRVLMRWPEAGCKSLPPPSPRLARRLPAEVRARDAVPGPHLAASFAQR